MIDPGNMEAAAIRLAELSREIDDLERGRASLLERLNRAREVLQTAGQRTARMRASVGLLCEHMQNVSIALIELRAIEEEMNEIGMTLTENGKEVTGLLFEADSFKEALDETDDDLDRVSTILLEGKPRRSRGH
ncbi:MAG: hypothetical protein L0229_08260 [Blastocatellia bacterium]|nr:hypothetical protein [Blastocatellia bacterium]